MFKSWRNDKNMFKAVFKLQFQATQVPKLKKSAVMISLVPEDVGKPTFKLEKVAVKDGTCSWENPIYVTVKLIKEPKTGKIKEKIYHFIVSTGSSKSGFLGEASIDFADFAAETEPLTVSLPLKFANSGAILNVTIEKMQGAIDQRYIEENGDMTLPLASSLKNQPSNYSTDGKEQNFADDEYMNLDASPNAEQIGNVRASIGSGTTVASCWDTSSQQNAQQNPMSLQSPLRQNPMPQGVTVDAIKTKNHAHRRSNTDWSLGSVSDGSLVDSSNSLDDNLPREWQEASDNSVEKLKNELAVVMRQAELSELELQSLRKQIAKESKRAQDQTRQIIELSEERNALRRECEQLKKQNYIDFAENESQFQSENEHLKVLQEEIREELNHEKELSANLRLQLQKTQDSNAELIFAVKDLNELLEQKNMEIYSLSSKLGRSEDEHRLALEELAEEHRKDKEIDMLQQKILDQREEIEFFKKHSEDLEINIKQLTEDCEVLQQENHCLSSDLEQNEHQQSMKTRECLESLATIKELESQVERLEDKIKQQSQEYSESLISINELQYQVKELKRELERQAQQFEDDLDAVTRAKTEQEQRAIGAEEALRKTRCKNAITAERLQEEFKRLSMETASKFDESEKLAVEAQTEANELRMQKRNLEQMLQKARDELGLIKDQNGFKLQELSNQIDLKEKQIEEMSLELDHRSKQLEYVQKSEAQKHEAFSMEIHTLRTEIEKLKSEKYNFSKHAKLRDGTEPIASTGETNMLVQRWDRERDDLEKKYALVKNEAEKAHEELISIRSLKDENEMMIGNLQAEVENLRVQKSELKYDLIEEKMEKDNLTKQVFQLKDELLKKEELESSIEQVKVVESDEYNNLIRKKKACSEKRQTFLASCSSDEDNLTELLTEVTILKEKNKRMETELKEMQERYSEISLKFAEVEGERQQLVMTVRNLKNGKKN